MTRAATILSLLPVLMPPALPAMANDGFGGLAATGLKFGHTDAVAMESEDLFIGIDRIFVDYTFRNRTGADVTGEVIFPLPPLSLGMLADGMMVNLPGEGPPYPDNLVGFTATVEGRPVAVTIDRLAVIEPEWDENAPPRQQYDTPGRDVKAELARFGLPLTLDADAVVAALLALPPAERAAVKAAGLAEFYDGDPSGDVPESVYPAWSIISRYHWTQTFPAGATLHIHHEYGNYPPGGIFYWEDPIPDDSYLQDLARRYCVDKGTSAAIYRQVERRDPDTGELSHFGMAYNIEYVLRTANSWAGPIGQFRLTLDKGDRANVISLCAEGVKKTGPTTFVIEKRDWSPSRDLEILVVVPARD